MSDAEKCLFYRGDGSMSGFSRILRIFSGFCLDTNLVHMKTHHHAKGVGMLQGSEVTNLIFKQILEGS